MKLRVMIVGFLGILGYSATLNAATLLEVALDGEVGYKMWIEGNKLRQDVEGGYVMLMDWDAGTAYMINTAEGIAMDTSHIMAAKPGKKDQKRSVDGISVDKVGAGPTIAGYETVHYRISVDGEDCENIYTSTKVIRDIGADIFDRLQSMADNDDDDMDYGYGDPCDKADEAYDLAKLGYPMRTEDASSGEVIEVTRIEVDAKLPDGGFEVPAGIQIMDMNQMMQMYQNPPTDD